MIVLRQHRWIPRNTWRAIGQSLVRPVLIIVFGVRLHYMVQLLEAEAEKVIQALTFQAVSEKAFIN